MDQVGLSRSVQMSKTLNEFSPKHGVKLVDNFMHKCENPRPDSVVTSLHQSCSYWWLFLKNRSQDRWIKTIFPIGSRHTPFIYRVSRAVWPDGSTWAGVGKFIKKPDNVKTRWANLYEMWKLLSKFGQKMLVGFELTKSFKPCIWPFDERFVASRSVNMRLSLQTPLLGLPFSPIWLLKCVLTACGQRGGFRSSWPWCHASGPGYSICWHRQE